MGLLFEEIILTGTKKTKNIRALFDSGAHRNYLRKIFRDEDKADDLGFRAFLGKSPVMLPNEEKISAVRIVFDNIIFRGYTFYNIEFIMMDNLIQDAILGAHFMQEHGIILDLNKDKIKMRK